jgi:hypothetical protein
MPMPREDWPPEEEYARSVDLEEWAYAGDVAGVALNDHLHDTAELEDLINSVFEEHEGMSEGPSYDAFSGEEQENQDPANNKQMV